MRFEPIYSTFLLNFFCSDAEHASMKGDLIEQYQAGRSDFWYNRQVLGMVGMALYNKVARRSFMRPSAFATGENILLSALLLGWVLTLADSAFFLVISAITAASLIALRRYVLGG